jgi:hypothetical protein
MERLLKVDFKSTWNLKTTRQNDNASGWWGTHAEDTDASVLTRVAMGSLEISLAFHFAISFVPIHLGLTCRNTCLASQSIPVSF